jgi:hypothetical protein
VSLAFYSNRRTCSRSNVLDVFATRKKLLFFVLH